MSDTPNYIEDSQLGHIDKSVLTESMIEALQDN